MEMPVTRTHLKSERSGFEGQSVAIIGSGMIGKSWGLIFLRAGFTVRFYDVDPFSLDTVSCWIANQASDLMKIGLIRNYSKTEQLISRIVLTKTLKEACQGVCWVQENVPENLKAKCDLFSELDSLFTPETSRNVVFASSTSAIKSSLFTSHLKNITSQVLVCHPINPPHLIPLVEVVPHPLTSKETIDRSMKILQAVGQSPVLLNKEIDNFIVNRLQGAILLEAFKLVQDGFISCEDLDKTLKDGLGLRWSFMGPFETLDLNAPKGIRDYCERYGPAYHELAKQQQEVREWNEELVAKIEKERREQLSLEQIPDRCEWRNRRLMSLIAHKQTIKDQKEK